jgi:hypothetical protein
MLIPTILEDYRANKLKKLFKNNKAIELAIY